MKLCKSYEEYIEYVAPYAQKACKRFEVELGKPFYLPSVLIAQAIHENGASLDPKAQILVKVGNMCGIKRSLLNHSWTDRGLGCWSGEYINKKTPEVYGGVPTEIYDDFRVYKTTELGPDVEESFMDYLCFMRWGGYSVGNPKYYPHIKDLHDYKSIAKTVHKLGYATGVTYSDALIRHIEKWGLTKYDDLTNVEPSKIWPPNAPSVLDKKEGGKDMAKLNIKKNYLKNNRCYQQAKKRKPIGIQIHSIGTSQNTGQALADYWNQQSIGVCVTYAADAETEGLALQFMPEEYSCWADKGWGNKSLICIEMMESDYIRYTGNGADYVVTNQAKFRADILRSYKTAVLLCADICKRYGWNPTAKLSNGMFLISSHNEGRIAGLSSAHVDPDHVWSRFGLTMAQFRRDVAAAMGGGVIIIEPTDIQWYRVRKSWADEKSQLGAYQYLQNAKDNCPKGYKVYDSKGKEVYSAPETAPKPSPTPSPDSGTKYRVRLGIFSERANIDRLKKNVKEKLNLDCFEEAESDGVHVYCGSFGTYTNAVARSTTLNRAGFDTKIIEVK